MLKFLSNCFPSSKRRTCRPSIASHIENCESRMLLSGLGIVPAEVCVEPVQHHHTQQSPIHIASLSNFNGDWQISAGSYLHLVQSGGSVTGTQLVFGSTVANFSGTVHGKKLTGDLVSIGIDAHSTIKVHLTDATHFSGKRHYFINGASNGTKTMVGVQI